MQAALPVRCGGDAGEVWRRAWMKGLFGVVCNEKYNGRGNEEALKRWHKKIDGFIRIITQKFVDVSFGYYYYYYYYYTPAARVLSPRHHFPAADRRSDRTPRRRSSPASHRRQQWRVG